MRLVFSPSALRGTVTAPPSKSMAHRLLLCAALAAGESRIENLAPSEDVCATLDCLQALGASVRGGSLPFPVISSAARNPSPSPEERISPLASLGRDDTEGSRDGDGRVLVRGFDPFAASGGELDCRESGSTLRFLLPLCLLSGARFTLRGSPRLLRRPLSVYEALCRARGLLYEKSETGVTVCGPLQPGHFAIPGGISSQFASGLLFALPLLDGDSTLALSPPVVSRPYLDMTLAALREFGVIVHKKAGDLYEIPGRQRYTAASAAVEGDWSNAAPFYALRALGWDVTVSGLRPDSLQGDRACVKLLETLRQGFAAIDLADCPDLGPVLFSAAALLHGGRFTGAGRLRGKESDRLAAMQKELSKCGAALCAEGDALTVTPAPLHAPREALSSHNDHRVAMALSLPLLRTGGTLTGAEAVSKSWPGFFDALRRLDAEVRDCE